MCIKLRARRFMGSQALAYGAMPLFLALSDHIPVDTWSVPHPTGLAGVVSITLDFSLSAFLTGLGYPPTGWFS
jgi:hypothetical protein